MKNVLIQVLSINAGSISKMNISGQPGKQLGFIPEDLMGGES